VRNQRHPRTVSLPMRIVLAGLVAAGCTGPPEINLVVQVFNQTNVDGSLSWQGSGNSGQAPIRPCRESGTAYGLGPGTWQVTITDPSTSLVTGVTGAANGNGIAYEVYAIRPDGRIEHLYRLSDQETAPAAPSGC